MRWQRSLILVAVLGVCACGDGDPTLARPSAKPTGQWYAGDFHVHTSVGSNDTRYPDGSTHSFPDAIRQTASERGMAFVTLTDHSNSTGSRVDTTAEDADLWNRGPEFPLWQTAAALSSESFLMIDASELSPVSTLDPRDCPNCPTLGTGQLTPVGHIGCIPQELGTFNLAGPFIDRPPGQISGGSGIEQCHARGGFAIVNHPFYRSTPWIDYDWTSYDYDAIEVWNGSAGFASFDRAAYDAYLCDRLAGRHVVGVGGSDNHRTPLPYEDSITIPLGAPLGLPMTSVFAAKLDWQTIMQSVRRGQIVIHERGTFVEFDLADARGTYLGGVGDRISSPPSSVTVRLTGRSPRAQELRLVYAAPGSCTERRQSGRDVPPVVASVVVHTQTVCAIGPCEFDERLAITPAPGLYYATVGGFATAILNTRDVAVTNVIEIAAK